MELYYFICYTCLCGLLWGVSMYEVKYSNFKICKSITLKFKDYKEINRYFEKYDLEVADGSKIIRGDDCKLKITEI